jgi:inositol oxygenase
MAIWGERQFAVVGDTFPLGCQFADSIVFRNDTFQDNEDLKHPVYSTKNGVYQEGIGLGNVTMSWGHDEYFYRCLLHNKTTLPEEGLHMIRFHSFYPWHTGGDYMHLCQEKDLKMLPWIREFNKFDLYSKCDVMPDIESLKPYYQSLIDKYIPGALEW